MNFVCRTVLHIHCPGTTGHGSLLHANTAGEKVASILAQFVRFRNGELAKLTADPELRLGDVTTINLTMLRGGVQVNVVPNAMRISFDIRLAVAVQHEEFEEMVFYWCPPSARLGRDYIESEHQMFVFVYGWIVCGI